MASDRKMEAIASGTGSKPTPFMTQGDALEADAVWDSSAGLTAEELKAGKTQMAAKSAKKATVSKSVKSLMPDFVATHLCETLTRPPETEKQLASYVGLAPMLHQNGNVDKDRRLGLAGNARASKK